MKNEKINIPSWEENARELKGVLRDLTELHDRLGYILGDCEVWVNEHGGKE